MKIAIIGANGKQGRMLTNEALKRGHTVYAVCMNEVCSNDKAITINKSLFDLDNKTFDSLDAIVSAYGSGFDCDPTINKKAILHLSKLALSYDCHLVYLAGAGCLYTSSDKKMRVYESSDHPSFLKPISENIFLGYSEAKHLNNLKYTFVCPSLFFDYEGEKKGEYKVGCDEVVIYNKDNKSRISYIDFANAMIDEVENKKYLRRLITICEV